MTVPPTLFLDLVSSHFARVLGSLLGLARVSFRPWGACSMQAWCAAIVSGDTCVAGPCC